MLLPWLSCWIRAEAGPAHNFMAANNFATFRKVFNENSHKLCVLDEEGSVNAVRAPVDVAAGKYTSLITLATVNESAQLPKGSSMLVCWS